MNAHEKMFALSFITPAKRDRYLSLLESAKGRKKVLEAFHHFHDLDDRFAKLIDANQQYVEVINKILRQKGAPEICYVMSTNSDIDHKEMPLREALSKVVGSSESTLVSCIAGELGYFENEDLRQRYILER